MMVAADTWIQVAAGGFFTFTGAVGGILLGREIDRRREAAKKAVARAERLDDYRALAKVLRSVIFTNGQVAANNGRGMGSSVAERYEIEPWDVTRHRFAELCPHPFFVAEISRFFELIRVGLPLSSGPLGGDRAYRELQHHRRIRDRAADLVSAAAWELGVPPPPLHSPQAPLSGETREK